MGKSLVGTQHGCRTLLANFNSWTKLCTVAWFDGFTWKTKIGMKIMDRRFTTCHMPVAPTGIRRLRHRKMRCTLSVKLSTMTSRLLQSSRTNHGVCIQPRLDGLSPSPVRRCWHRCLEKSCSMLARDQSHFWIVDSEIDWLNSDGELNPCIATSDEISDSLNLRK